MTLEKGSQKIAHAHAIIVTPHFLNTITHGEFTVKKKKKPGQITTMCFSYPHTNLGGGGGGGVSLKAPGS